MMLGVLFQGPGYTPIYGKCGCGKMKNGDKIGGKSGKMGGGVVSGSRMHFQIWKVCVCQK
jgi:hypothetical protein